VAFKLLLLFIIVASRAGVEQRIPLTAYVSTMQGGRSFEKMLSLKVLRGGHGLDLHTKCEHTKNTSTKRTNNRLLPLISSTARIMSL
jgi:hypothetical protein